MKNQAYLNPIEWLIKESFIENKNTFCFYLCANTFVMTALHKVKFLKISEDKHEPNMSRGALEYILQISAAELKALLNAVTL